MPTCSRPPRILPGGSSPIQPAPAIQPPPLHPRLGSELHDGATHAPSASPWLSPLRPHLSHARAASARQRVRSRLASVAVLTLALPLLPCSDVSRRGSPRRRTSTACAKPRTGDHRPVSATVQVALCAGRYRHFSVRRLSWLLSPQPCCSVRLQCSMKCPKGGAGSVTFSFGNSWMSYVITCKIIPQRSWNQAKKDGLK